MHGFCHAIFKECKSKVLFLPTKPKNQWIPAKNSLINRQIKGKTV